MNLKGLTNIASIATPKAVFGLPEAGACPLLVFIRESTHTYLKTQPTALAQYAAPPSYTLLASRPSHTLWHLSSPLCSLHSLAHLSDARGQLRFPSQKPFSWALFSAFDSSSLLSQVWHPVSTWGPLAQCAVMISSTRCSRSSLGASARPPYFCIPRAQSGSSMRCWENDQGGCGRSGSGVGSLRLKG